MGFAAVPIAYFSVYLGLLNPARNIVLSGDYSYGIYLYGFPVQQAVVQLLPTHREWYWNLVIALPVVIVIAVLSWWLVEKPCLARRSLIQIGEDRWCARTSRHAVEAQERA
jgi:peptidoglycan/LPS O-acetylase OafA/YrhL